MKWAMYLRVDAVLTNDPKRYLDLRDKHVASTADCPETWPWRARMTLYFWSWMGFISMTLRVWRFSGRGGWKEKLGNVEERIVKGGITEKAQEIRE